MPLSEQEQRLLDEMERNLYQNDADFVASVGGGRRGRPNYTALVVGVLLGVAGIATLIGGAALGQPVIGVLGFIVMFVGVLLAFRSPKPDRLGRSSGTPSTSHPSSRKRGLMDRVNDRWDKRQDGNG
jgi:hypothetical protein